MVRPSGVEPPLLSEHGPEPCASANSATGAPWIQPEFTGRLGRREISRPSGVVNDYGAQRTAGVSPGCGRDGRGPHSGISLCPPKVWSFRGAAGGCQAGNYISEGGGYWVRARPPAGPPDYG